MGCDSATLLVPMNTVIERNRRTLVIDDNRSIHEDFRKVLAPSIANAALDLTETALFGSSADAAPQTRFEVDSAYQGEEGIQMVKVALAAQRPYAMAFVDVRMPPGLDGIETIRRIWEVDGQIQIVICTAYSDYSWGRMIDRLGRSDRLLILKKPFDNIEVLQLAGALTEKWRLEQAALANLQNLQTQVDARTAQLQNAMEQLKSNYAELEHASNARRTSEEQFRDLFENAHDLIQSLTPEGRFSFVNRRWKEVLGYNDEEIRAMSIFDLLDPEDIQPCRTRMETLFQVGRLDHLLVVFIAKNGNRVHLEGNINCKYENGIVAATRGIFRDVTERDRLEKELIQARDEALGAAKLKSEFLANMSHEIRTPMNGVIGMTGLLLDTDLDSQQRQYAQTIRHSGESLLTIINDILDFSKIEAGKLSFELLDFSVMEVVEDTLDLLAEQAQSKGLELACQFPAEIPDSLRGDPSRLRQILMNFVGNAVKFTEKGEVAVRVAIERETETDLVLRFEVEDTGIGIPPEIQTRLFCAFSQADGTTTRKFGGTGLGLAICKQLVGLMNGSVGVQSQVGEGSLFWFSVKLEKSNAPEAVEMVQPQVSLASLRVLVVDDNATNREILNHQIIAWKMKNGCAASGQEALRLLRDASAEGRPYDLALLDMQMPEMDGLALARAIKSDSTISATRLIILTSLNQQQSAEELRAAGIDAYLTKPVKQKRLFECLLNVLGKAGKQSRARNRLNKESVAAPPHVASKARILLVEDNQVNQMVANGQLHKLGYTADMAGNGLEALECIGRIPYDIILMDCQMPEMDGYEATRQIRSREKSATVPLAPVHIIAMTANALEGEREKCLEAGMDDYISKPVRLPDLQKAIERWKARVLVSLSGAIASAIVASPVEQSAEHPPIDLERLHEITDNDPDELWSLLTLFRTGSAAGYKILLEAVPGRQMEIIRQSAHKLAGSSSTCGMDPLASRLQQLELSALHQDVHGINIAFEQVKTEYRRLEIALSQVAADIGKSL
jgi:two-component system sensor histidine kinase/response regulator